MAGNAWPAMPRPAMHAWWTMAGHGRPWLAMHGLPWMCEPWPIMAGMHDRPWPRVAFTHAWMAMVWPWPSMTGHHGVHGKPCIAGRGRLWRDMVGCICSGHWRRMIMAIAMATEGHSHGIVVTTANGHGNGHAMAAP